MSSNSISMARKRSTKKKKTRRRRQPSVSLSNRQGVSTVVHVHNAPASRDSYRRRRTRRRKRKPPELNAFQLAQLIPERRHYFSGNKAFNNSKQSAYDLAKIESKIAGQYSDLTKKLESFGKLDRTTRENAQSIAVINAMLTRGSRSPASSRNSSSDSSSSRNSSSSGSSSRDPSPTPVPGRSRSRRRRRSLEFATPGDGRAAATLRQD
jgi:hypothetical protein